jgi:hypothetical protein
MKQKRVARRPDADVRGELHQSFLSSPLQTGVRSILEESIEMADSCKRACSGSQIRRMVDRSRLAVANLPGFYQSIKI